MAASRSGAGYCAQPVTGPARGSPLGVLRKPLPVDHDARLVPDDPRVVAGRDDAEVSRTELHLFAVVHDDLHPAGYEVAHMGGLATVGLRDGLDVLGPFPARLELRPAHDPRRGVPQPHLPRAPLARPGFPVSIESLS